MGNPINIVVRVDDEESVESVTKLVKSIESATVVEKKRSGRPKISDRSLAKKSVSFSLRVDIAEELVKRHKSKDIDKNKLVESFLASEMGFSQTKFV